MFVVLMLTDRTKETLLPVNLCVSVHLLVYLPASVDVCAYEAVPLSHLDAF